jgi:hypothetical protein
MKEDLKKQIGFFVLGILVVSILVALSWANSNMCNTMTAVGTIIVSISVIFLYYQLRVSKNVAISDFVAKIDEEFYSPELLEIRKNTAKLDFSKYDKARDCEDILDFFEKIAYLEKEGVISLDVVDAMWGYWIERYWLLCKKHVYDIRIKKDDYRYYATLENLFEKIALLGIKNLQAAKNRMSNAKVQEYSGRISKDLEEFKKDESDL